MDAEYHFGFLIPDFCIWMSLALNNKLFDCVHFEFWGFELFSSNSEECNEQVDVNSLEILQYSPNNLLKTSFLFVTNNSLVVLSGVDSLASLSYFLLFVEYGILMWSFLYVFIFFEQIFDVSRHGYINIPVFVLPVKYYPRVESLRMFHGFLHPFVNRFKSEVINNQHELD